jgi:hypothetical protein
MEVPTSSVFKTSTTCCCLLWVGGYSRSILEIQLPTGERFRTFNRTTGAERWAEDALMLAQDAPDCAGRAWQTLAHYRRGRFLLQIVQDGFGARNTLKILRWLVTNGQNAVNDDAAEWRGRCRACARVALQHGIVVGCCRAQPFGPLFTQPSDRPMVPAKSGSVQSGCVASKVRKRRRSAIHCASMAALSLSATQLRGRVYTAVRKPATMSVPQPVTRTVLPTFC